MPGPSSRNYYSCEHIWLSKEQWTMWHQHLQLLSHPGLFSLFMFIHRQGYTAIVNAVKWNCVYTHIWASFSRAGISAVLCHFFLVTVILYSPTFLPLPSSMYFSLYLSFLSLLWLSWPFPKISVFPRHSLLNGVFLGLFCAKVGEGGGGGTQCPQVSRTRSFGDDDYYDYFVDDVYGGWLFNTDHIIFSASSDICWKLPW